MARKHFEKFEAISSAVPAEDAFEAVIAVKRRDGDESLHNLTYWRGGFYLAAGPSASSYLPGGEGLGVRLKNPTMKGWLNGEDPEVDVLTPEDVVLERLLTGLRTVEGVDLSDLESLTGISLETHAERWLADCLSHRLLTLSQARVLRATPDGLARLDGVLRAFVAARSPSLGSARA